MGLESRQLQNPPSVSSEVCNWCVAAEPRYNMYPAVIGAAIGGMLFAALLTVLLLVFIIRNRHNHPRESHTETGGLCRKERGNNTLALMFCFLPQGSTTCCLDCECLIWRKTPSFGEKKKKVLSFIKGNSFMLMFLGSTASRGKTLIFQRMKWSERQREE